MYISSMLDITLFILCMFSFGIKRDCLQQCENENFIAKMFVSQSITIKESLKSMNIRKSIRATAITINIKRLFSYLDKEMLLLLHRSSVRYHLEY